MLLSGAGLALNLEPSKKARHRNRLQPTPSNVATLLVELTEGRPASLVLGLVAKAQIKGPPPQGEGPIQLEIRTALDLLVRSRSSAAVKVFEELAIG